MRARWIIHTVGPMWRGGGHGEDEQLANCYRSSLALAELHGVRTIAFPPISTGVRRFPMDRAASIAVAEARRWLASRPRPQDIIFVCLSDAAYESYEQIMGDLQNSPHT